jgi:hypothetical protein
MGICEQAELVTGKALVFKAPEPPERFGRIDGCAPERDHEATSLEAELRRTETLLLHDLEHAGDAFT